MKKIFSILLLALIFFPSVACASTFSRSESLSIKVYRNGEIADNLLGVNILSCNSEYNAGKEEKTLKYLSETYDPISRCYWYEDTLPPGELVFWQTLNNRMRPCSIYINGECKDNTGIVNRYKKKYVIPEEFRIGIVDYENNTTWISDPMSLEYNNANLIIEINDGGQISYFQEPRAVDTETNLNFIFDLILNIFVKVSFVGIFIGNIAKYFTSKNELEINREDVLIRIDKYRSMRISLVISMAAAALASTLLKWYVLSYLIPLSVLPYATLLATIIVEMLVVYYLSRKHITWKDAFYVTFIPNLLIVIVGFLPSTRRYFGVSGSMYYF